MRLENFAKNLQFFFNEKSVRELNFVQQNNISLKNHKLQTSAIVIDGGTSISKKNHLEQLLESNLDGTIVITHRMLLNH